MGPPPRLRVWTWPVGCVLAMEYPFMVRPRGVPAPPGRLMVAAILRCLGGRNNLGLLADLESLDRVQSVAVVAPALHGWDRTLAGESVDVTLGNLPALGELIGGE